LEHLRAKWPEGKGVREFIRILRLHSDHPADLIVQAVTQALAYGCGHLDGVQLCLRHLTEPGTSISAIDLSGWPQFIDVGTQEPDLSRYDQLLGGS
jgi:hypothetical protein